MSVEKQLAVDEILAGTAREVRAACFGAFRPQKRLSVSEWADAHRVLPEDSAMKGAKWSTAFTPYLKGVMDAFTDPAVEEIAVVKSAQVGFTEATVNVILYVVFYALGSVLHVHPKEDAARNFSLKRLSPMLRLPIFDGKIAPAKSRDSGNTILRKTFAGGDYIAVGANSPTNLASNPIAFVILDEYDRIAASAGKEGSPLELARKRTTTFWNRKILVGSTPTGKRDSKIAAEWERSDKRRYFIPCKACGELFSPLFTDVAFDSDASTHRPLPETARLRCPRCGALHTNVEKNAAVADPRAGWRATAVSAARVAGFHVNQILSPFHAASLEKIVESYADCVGDPLKMQVWTNTVLGEPWEEDAAAVSGFMLAGRAAKFDGEGFDVPARGLVLTIGADTQPDRIEAECVAWGAGEESWSLDYRVFHGDPHLPEGAEGSPWDAFLAWTRRRWRHEAGGEISASVKFIDSGGANTQDVYRFCAAHRWEQIYAIKGANTLDAPILGAVQRRRIAENRSRGVKFVMLGTQKIKDIVIERFSYDSGPGCCHFPPGRDAAYYEQLAAEYKKTFVSRGNAVAVWVKKSADARNEALDCRVYAFAALRLTAVNWQAEGLRRRKLAEAAKERQASSVERQADTAVFAEGKNLSDCSEPEARSLEPEARSLEPEARSSKSAPEDSALRRLYARYRFRR